MAKKQRAFPIQLPPYSSSSYEEIEDSSSSSDEEQTNNSSKPDPKETPIQNQESESEEESSNDEEDEDEDEGEDENPQPVKPTPSKPEPKSEKKMVAPSKPIPNKSNGKSPIVRIWSVDDEIAILQAMLDYQTKNGRRINLNAATIKDLHDSIRKSLSIDVDTAKLVEKMRRIRKKYVGASKKGAKLKFVKAHDKTIYELSDMVWGKKEEDGFKADPSNANSGGPSASKGKSLKREFPFLRDALSGNRLALEMLETVDVNKAGTLEENFKKLKSAEINLTREVYNLLQ